MSIISSPPSRFATVSLHRVKQTEVIKVLKEFFSRDNIETGKNWRCLVLSGPPGVGKTVGIYGLLNGRRILCHLLHDDELEIGVITPSFFSEYHCAPFEEKHDILDEALCIDILCMDDVGMEEPSYRNIELLETILDYRYSEQMTTIITTNLPAEAFRARYPERIIDRLREWGTFVELAGKSLRENPDQEFPPGEETDWDRVVKEMTLRRQKTLAHIKAMDEKTRERLVQETENYLRTEGKKRGHYSYWGEYSESMIARNMPEAAEKLNFFQDEKVLVSQSN